MTTEDKVTKVEEPTVEKAPNTATDVAYVPEVDIAETDDVIRLTANVPGADPGAVDISVENSVLTIDASAAAENAPQGYELVGQEYGVGKFRRSFTLSNQVDVDGIKARVAHGVLTLSIPKRDEVKTKKIQIEA
jgi:HSP20 family protein